MYLDAIGRCTRDPIWVRVVLLPGGTVPITGPDGIPGMGERRAGGRGLWIPVGAGWYSIPTRSLVQVLEGSGKKAPVFGIRVESRDVYVWVMVLSGVSR